MTSERYEPITPVRHEQAEVTDSEVNEALEKGDLDTAGSPAEHPARRGRAARLRSRRRATAAAEESR